MKQEMHLQGGSAILGLVLACVAATGCNRGDQPDLGQVQGTILVDGEPANNIVVAFTQTGFRSSRGFTNKDGFYELNYVHETQGAVVGEHSVKLRFMGGETGPMPKQLPPKYNSETELTATVKPGMNTIDFNLVTR